MLHIKALKHLENANKAPVIWILYLVKALQGSCNDFLCFGLQLLKRHGLIRRDVKTSELLNAGGNCATLKIDPVISNKAFVCILVWLSQLRVLKQVSFLQVVKSAQEEINESIAMDVLMVMALFL